MFRWLLWYCAPDLTDSPTSIPAPAGTAACESLSSAQANWRSTPARVAATAEANTARTSSPRISTTLPPRPSTASVARSTKRAASLAASSCPRSRVNVE